MSRRSAIPAQPSSFVVYGFYDAAGDLLYIGQTNNLKRRVYAHRARHSAFIDEAHTIRVLGGGSTRAAVTHLEALLISSMRPFYNVAYNTQERTDMRQHTASIPQIDPEAFAMLFRRSDVERIASQRDAA